MQTHEHLLCTYYYSIGPAYARPRLTSYVTFWQIAKDVLCMRVSVMHVRAMDSSSQYESVLRLLTKITIGNAHRPAHRRTWTCLILT